MKNLKIILAVSHLLSSLAISASIATQYNGYYATEKSIRERLFVADNQFKLAEYIGSTELGELLGVRSGEGLESAFINGLPNGTNISLWNVVMSALSKDISNVCTGSFSKEAQLKSEALQTLQTLCKWPADSARNAEVLEAYWTLLMGYQAPYEETEVWLRFFMQPKFESLSGPEIVNELTNSILLNPYFLLRN